MKVRTGLAFLLIVGLAAVIGVQQRDTHHSAVADAQARPRPTGTMLITPTPFPPITIATEVCVNKEPNGLAVVPLDRTTGQVSTLHVRLFYLCGNQVRTQQVDVPSGEGSVARR